MLTDLNERLLQPPKPPMPKLIVQKPVVDVVSLQRTVAELERANADYVQQVKKLNDVITSLRRELAGAMAKLSDTTGELLQTFRYWAISSWLNGQFVQYDR